MKPNLLTIAAAAVLFTACASSNEIISFGPDTYTITAESYSHGDAKNEAIQKANEYATSKGLYMIPIRTTTRSHYTEFGNVTTYDLTFRAVTKDDPEYLRTNLTTDN